MPTYSYACGTCDHRFEAVQSIHDDALTTCPECGGTLRKVFGSVGVTFKGSGFYRTDSRAGRSSSSAPASSSSKSSGSSSTGSSSSSSSTGTSSGSAASA